MYHIMWASLRVLYSEVSAGMFEQNKGSQIANTNTCVEKVSFILHRLQAWKAVGQINQINYLYIYLINGSLN